MARSFDHSPLLRTQTTAWDQEASSLASVGHGYDYNLSDEVTAYVKKDTGSGNVLTNDVWAYDNAGNWTSKGTATAMRTGPTMHSTSSPKSAVGAARWSRGS